MRRVTSVLSMIAASVAVCTFVPLTSRYLSDWQCMSADGAVPDSSVGYVEVFELVAILSGHTSALVCDSPLRSSRLTCGCLCAMTLTSSLFICVCILRRL